MNKERILGKTRERVVFRFIHMPCCGYLFCCVNARLPNYCIECGKFVFALLKPDITGAVKLYDDNAELHHKAG